MLTIPESIAEAIEENSGKYSPAMFLDVFAETGPMDSVANTSRWLGTNDPAVANDVDVDAIRRRGGIVLAAGTAVAPVPAGTNTLITTMSATIRRTDRYHYKGTIGKLGGNPYGYDGSDFPVLNNDTARFQSFTAANTQVIDDIVVAARFTGYQTMPVIVKLVNSATGNQVGKSVTFTPTGIVTRHTLSGFAAGVVAGRIYRIEFKCIVPSQVGPLLGPPSVSTDYTMNVELYAYSPVDPAWRIYMGSGLYIATGGRPNYKASGSFQRTIDVGSIPVDFGVISISDIIPSGTTMNIALYFTDSAVVAAEVALTNWTSFTGTVVSGVSLTAHRYWRFDVDMTASAAGDLSPALISVAIRFIPEPVTLGTTATRTELQLYNGLALPLILPITWTTSKRLLQTGFKALNTVSAASAQLSPQFAGSMIGGVTAQIAPEPIVHDLVNKFLRGKRVDVRAGYVGIDDTLQIYSGSINDFSFSNNLYKLDIADNFKIADVSIPATKAGDEWAISTGYSVNDIVVHGASSYRCIADHTSSASDEPGVGGSWTTYWVDNGTVWASIDYTVTTSPDAPAEWHLADIITDILTNQINIPSERIDFAAIAAVKAALPNRRGTRLLSKPTKATALLGELAWLLGAQFVTREGLFSLTQEATAGTEPVESIVPNDIAPNSLTYRRGWREMVNQGVIITGYDGDGDGQDKFSKGEALADTTSQTNYDATVQKDWEDKWNLDASELQLILTDMNDKYSDGRRVLGCTTSMRLLAVEPGDVIVLSSGQLPAGDAGPITCMIISKKLDFAKQTIKFVMLEV
ncbi:MAG: hypothetical protein KAR40_11200 [Candidatus Sabulitectum sp.]|nr:hypothetical protein [Candidatus Sabulitectum sp.]